MNSETIEKTGTMRVNRGDVIVPKRDPFAKPAAYNRPSRSFSVPASAGKRASIQNLMGKISEMKERRQGATGPKAEPRDKEGVINAIIENDPNWMEGSAETPKRKDAIRRIRAGQLALDSPEVDELLKPGFYGRMKRERPDAYRETAVGRAEGRYQGGRRDPFAVPPRQRALDRIRNLTQQLRETREQLRKAREHEVAEGEEKAEPEEYKRGGVVRKGGMAKVHKGERKYGDGRTEAAFHEVFTNEPSTVRRANVSGERKRRMKVVIALAKARKAGARIPEKR